MPEYVVEKTKEMLNETDTNKVTVFGLTYKGDVDDIRESPAFDIYELLRKEPNVDVVAYDPHVKLDWVEQDVHKAVEDSSLVLILSDHSQFKTLTDEDFKTMKNKIIFDTKNIVQNELTDTKYYTFGNVQKFTK